ncbi:MAG: pseudouridine synthase, partial [Muribaculaceae bacterium]|nr:pseudouridine synthase [Muribaculaceae bacterium]
MMETNEKKPKRPRISVNRTAEDSDVSKQDTQRYERINYNRSENTDGENPQPRTQGGYQPRQQGGYRRYNNQGGYNNGYNRYNNQRYNNQEGGYQPRQQQEGGYQPHQQQEGGYQPRQQQEGG